MATARMSQVIRRDSAMRKTTVIKTKREPEQQCLDDDNKVTYTPFLEKQASASLCKHKTNKYI